MLQGYTRPKRADIFGPYATGGSMNDAGERQLYQHGEGIGSIFSSLFSKFLPAAARTVKNIAQSKIVQDTGKQILDSTITGLTNATANAISGDKTVKESISDELKNARAEISIALKKQIRVENLKLMKKSLFLNQKKKKESKKENSFEVKKEED